MFGKQAYDLLQEVAQCPADSLPAFNVSSVLRRLRRGLAFEAGCRALSIAPFKPVLLFPCRRRPSET